MLSDVRLLCPRSLAADLLNDRVDRVTRHQLASAAPEAWTRVLSTARFSPALPVLLAGLERDDGSIAPDRALGSSETFAAAEELAVQKIGVPPTGLTLAVAIEIDRDGSRFVVWLRRVETADIGKPAASAPALSSPVGQTPAMIALWFSSHLDQMLPEADGTLVSARRAAQAYQQAAISAHTRRAYRSAVKGWCVWAAGHKLSALPASAEDVAAYLADMALRQRKTTTIELHRAALTYLHRLAGVALPTGHPLVRGTMSGIRREHPDPTPRRVDGLTWELLGDVIETIPADGLANLRDRALLLMGFGGAFRRSELAGLTVEKIRATVEGLRITLPRSKGDQKGDGALVGIPRGVTAHCPVRAYERWIAAAGIDKGPVFRRVLAARRVTGKLPPLPARTGVGALTDRAIAMIIQARCQAAGLEGDFAGHSLRRGALTTGAQDGMDLLGLKRFARHATFKVVETYIDERDVLDKHPGKSRF